MNQIPKRFLFVLSSFLLLALSYRIDHYISWFTFPVAVTVGSYVALSVLLLLIADLVAKGLPKVLSREGSHPLLQIACVFSGYAALALLFGPFGFDVPGLRIRGIFFAEWKFFFFVLIDASALTCIYYLILIRMPQRTG